MVIYGFANPELFKKVYKQGGDIPAQIILLHASGDMLRKHLQDRHSTPESIKEIERTSALPVDKFIENNIEFAPKFREICEKYQVSYYRDRW